MVLVKISSQLETKSSLTSVLKRMNYETALPRKGSWKNYFHSHIRAVKMHKTKSFTSCGGVFESTRLTTAIGITSIRNMELILNM